MSSTDQPVAEGKLANVAANVTARADAVMNAAKNLVSSTSPLQIMLWITLAIGLGITIWYIIYKVTQKQSEIESTYVTMNRTVSPLNTLTNQVVDPMTMPLRNYYIKTALNCCCLGEWKNNYVDTVPLKSAISDGYRCLDFEIYSEDDKPVVAASTKPSFYFRETYNSIPFLDAMTVLAQNAFTKAPNSTDPLFINLRIKSNNAKIVPDIVSAINSQFGNLLLGPEYNYLYAGNNLGQVPMSTFQNKVIIMADISNPLCTDKDLPLFQVLNIGANTPF